MVAFTGCGRGSHTITIDGVLTNAQFKEATPKTPIKNAVNVLELTFDENGVQRTVEVEPKGQYIVVVNMRQAITVVDGRITEVKLHEPAIPEEQDPPTIEVSIVNLDDLPDPQNIVQYKAPSAATPAYDKEHTIIIDGRLAEVTEGVDRAKGWQKYRLTFDNGKVIWVANPFAFPFHLKHRCVIEYARADAGEPFILQMYVVPQGSDAKQINLEELSDDVT
jgi:hypothetical protein